jgi:hypothetical protein
MSRASAPLACAPEPLTCAPRRLHCAAARPASGESSAPHSTNIFRTVRLNFSLFIFPPLEKLKARFRGYKRFLRRTCFRLLIRPLKIERAAARGSRGARPRRRKRREFTRERL